MTKSKKLSKILVSLILILVTSLSIVFVAMQINNANNDTNLSVSAVSDTLTNNLLIIEPYGIIDDIGCYKCNKDPKVGTTKDNPYREAPWYGRMKTLTSTFSDRYSNRMYTLQLNVDVRDIKLGIPDDVIVEFKFYYQEGTLGLKKNMNVDSLNIYTEFYVNGALKASPTRSCSSKSSAGFTIAGVNKTTMVKVHVTYTYHDDYYSKSNEVYFEFDGNEVCEHEKK